MPSGLNATPVTTSVWPFEGFADGFAGGRVPQPHRVVAAGGGEQRAVGAERHPVHRAVVASSSLRRPARRWPGPTAAPCRSPAGGGEERAVGAERHRGHAVGVALEGLADWLAGGRVPQPHRAVVAGGGEQRAVGAERHRRSPRSVWPCRGSPTGWPVAGSHSRTVAVVAGGGEQGAVGAERHRRPHRRRVACEGFADGLARWPGPTAAPCRRCWRRRAGCRRG